MKKSKILIMFKRAPFPAITTIVSFVLFICIYWFMTMRSIEPYYLGGLIFAIPFVSFGIITLFTATVKPNIIVSSILTGILIFIFGFFTFLTLIFMAFGAATTVTTDIDKYERVLKMSGYPNNQLIQYFPNKIPDNAKNIVFSYNPAFLQGGENFDLKFETDSDSIKNYIDEFSQKAKWIGKTSDSEAQKNGVSLASFNFAGYLNLRENFTIYLIDSEPYHPDNWNHGKLSLIAISQQRNEIIFLAEDW